VVNPENPLQELHKHRLSGLEGKNTRKTDCKMTGEKKSQIINNGELERGNFSDGCSGFKVDKTSPQKPLGS